MESGLQYRLDVCSDVFRKLVAKNYLIDKGMALNKCRLKDILVADNFTYEFPNKIMVCVLTIEEQETFYTPNEFEFKEYFSYGGYELAIFVKE